MEPVSKDVCEERSKVYDERFTRDKERLDEMEKMQKTMSDLLIKLTALLENQSKQVDKYEDRICAIEKKPQTWLDRLTSVLISAVISGVVAYLFVSAGLK